MSCEKEAEIKTIKNEVYGNGRLGLTNRMTTLESEMRALHPVIKNMNANLEVLTRYKTQEEMRTSLKKGNSQNKKWLIGMIITALLSLSAIVSNIVTIFI